MWRAQAVQNGSSGDERLGERRVLHVRGLRGGGIGERLPSVALVRCSLVGAYCQSGVEQQYALLSPTGKVARGRNRLAQVVLYLLENVLQ